MNKFNQELKINWSVWDDNPTVAWIYRGENFHVSLRTPPLSVVDLPRHALVGIVGNYEDLGSENLLFYSYNGLLVKKLAAPNLGSKSQFGRVFEVLDKVNATVGFFDQTGWVEKVGTLNIEDGTMGQFHRNY